MSMLLRSLGCAVTCLLMLLAAAGCREQGPVYQDTLLVFGTRVDISIAGVDDAKAAQAVAALDRDFARMHREWHAWQPGGALYRLNAAIAAGRRIDADPDLVALIERAAPLARESRGLFNPAIGRLIALWGFHNDVPPSGPPPDPGAIARLVAQRPSMDDLVIKNGTIGSRNPAVQLDFGAFAKGYAVDLAIERLRRMGIGDAIVNGGGDLRVIGRRGERPWRVGIQDPRGDGVIAVLDVADGEAVFTSGNYQRYREYRGRRYPHIIDPRSGRPVQHVASVTVVHHDGALADAAATALLVAGPREWLEIARSMHVEQAMMITDDGTIRVTAALAPRLEFQGSASGRVRVVKQ